MFHFKNDSLAEKDILSIFQMQEKFYEEITRLLKIYPNFKINYYLIEASEKVKLIYSEINNDEDIANITNWINNYPRKVLNGKTTQEVFIQKTSNIVA